MSIPATIVYHGTSLAPGTRINLNPPTLNDPFFIASHPEIAFSYITGNSGSVMVFKLSGPVSKLGLNLYSSSGLKRLRGVFPRTADLIERWRMVNSSNGEYSFWNLVQTLVGFLAFLVDDNDTRTVDKRMEDANKSEIKVEPAFTSRDFIPALCELGLTDVRSNGGLVFLDRDLKSEVAKAGEFNYENANEMTILAGVSVAQHKAGRIIKRPVNKAAYDMGYLMVGDFDSSFEEMDEGREWAVFDKSVFDSGIGVTITEDQVADAKKALLTGTEFVPTEIGDVNKMAADIMVKVGRRKSGLTSFPNIVRAKATEIIVPDNIVRVGDYSMSRMPRLERVEFGMNTVSFGIGVLSSCKSLRKVVFRNRDFDVRLDEDDSSSKKGNRPVELLFWMHDDLSKLEIVVPPGFGGQLDGVRKMGCKITVS